MTIKNSQGSAPNKPKSALAAQFLVWHDTTFPPVNLYNAPKLETNKSPRKESRSFQ